MSSAVKRLLIRAVVYFSVAGLLASATVRIFDIGEEGSWSRWAVLCAYMSLSFYFVFGRLDGRQGGRKHRDEGTPGAGQTGNDKQ